MEPGEGRGRAFVVAVGIAGGAVSGAMLGIVSSVLLGFVRSGVAVWEALVAAPILGPVLAALLLLLVARRGGTIAFLGLLLAAVFAAFDVLAAFHLGLFSYPTAVAPPALVVTIIVIAVALRGSFRLLNVAASLALLLALASVVVSVAVFVG